MYEELTRCLKTMLARYPGARDDSWRVANWLADHPSVPGVREHSLAIIAVARQGLASLIVDSLANSGDRFHFEGACNRAWLQLRDGGLQDATASTALTIWLKALEIEPPDDLGHNCTNVQVGTPASKSDEAPAKLGRGAPTRPTPTIRVAVLRTTSGRPPRHEEEERRVPYVSLGTRQTFLQPQSLPSVSRRLADTLKIEGPISQERAMLRVILAWNMTRVTPEIRTQFNLAMGQLVGQERPLIRDGFLWPRHLDPTAWQSYRTVPSDETPRQLADIPPEEISNAVEDIVFRASGVTREQLIRDTARCFSNSLNAANARRLSEVIESLLKAGHIEAVPD